MPAAGAPSTVRFPIRFDVVYRALASALFMPPTQSYVEVDGDRVSVRMGWGFGCEFARSAVKSVSRLARKPVSRGVHGFAGRWLVNGSGDGIVIIDLEPPQRGRVMGFPVKLRQLMVSVEQPSELATALASPGDWLHPPAPAH